VILTGVSALLSAINYFAEILTNDWRHKPSVINVYAMTMFSFVTGLGFLSLIPHQVNKTIQASFLANVTLWYSS
jgi:hypothetical protein